MQQNSRCRLYDNRDERINHIISECSKLAWKEYKTRHDCVQLCKKLKSGHTRKWYMRNADSHPENKMQKLLWCFEIQMDPLILVRRPDHIKIDKQERTCRILIFAVPADQRVKLKGSEKEDKYLNLRGNWKKLLR